MRIVEVSSRDQFDSCRREWNDLLSSAATRNVFLTWEWQSTWWRIYGRPRALRLLFAFDDEERLCGIAPLYRSSIYVGPLRFRTLEFIAGRHVASEYLDFIARADVHSEVVAAFLAELRRRRNWDLFLGYHTPAESPTLALLAEPAIRAPWAITRTTTSLYVPPADWDTYVSQLGKMTRKNLRYYRKGVANDLHATLCDLSDNIPQALPRLVDLHQKRMRELGLPGSFASARFGRFHEELARLLAEDRSGRFYALRIGDALIAANYGFVYGNTFSVYSVGFDSTYKDYSVGFVLWSHMLEQCMRERLEVDFLDPGRFKELWKPQQRQTVSYAIGASTRALAAYTRANASRSLIVGTVKRLLPARVADRVGVWKDSLLSRI